MAGQNEGEKIMTKSFEERGWWDYFVERNRQQLEDSQRAIAAELRDMRDAWRYPRDAAPPPARYPPSAGVGSACTINGQPGTLVREGEWLVCKPNSLGPTRGDSRTAGMHQRQADAWQQMVHDMETAWQKRVT
jgi:hypothetical protein